MQALKFTLNGRTAFFKKPDVNSNIYFTYGHIHKVALTGIFGAILGYKGYNSMNSYHKDEKKDKNKNKFPEFYEKLRDLKISIVPNNNCGIIDKKVNVFNNSVGYASKEQGGNLIVKEQWLENPSWDIYVLLDNDEAIKIKDAILNRSFVYIPYLGKNDHMAEFHNIEIFDCNKVSNVNYIDSFFKKEDYKISVKPSDEKKSKFSNSLKGIAKLKNKALNKEENIEVFKYEEKLPVALNEVTNLYILENLVYTNSYLNEINECLTFKVSDKTLQFI